MRDVETIALGDPRYPELLAVDHEAPTVIYTRGSRVALDHPRVAIIGTRRCTGYGRDVATRLGRGLAEAGVAVVSGLALGIDGAAHAGALGANAAPVIGVVGSGLDVVYPRQHRRLWNEVAERGLLMSEAPLGAPPERYRFPARNRIIAALSDAVVVVESHVRGGSNHTVAAAIDRSVPVLAVPGPITSSASAGTNRLISEGCAPVASIDDVLITIGLSPRRERPTRDRRPPPGDRESIVLAAIGWTPSTLENIGLRCGLPLPETAACLTRLEIDGWARAVDGWWERVAAPP